MTELLPWIDTALLGLIIVLVSALLGYVVKVEHRLTKLEGLPRRVGILESATFRHRLDSGDSNQKGNEA